MIFDSLPSESDINFSLYVSFFQTLSTSTVHYFLFLLYLFTAKINTNNNPCSHYADFYPEDDDEEENNSLLKKNQRLQEQFHILQQQHLKELNNTRRTNRKSSRQQNRSSLNGNHNLHQGNHLLETTVGGGQDNEANKSMSGIVASASSSSSALLLPSSLYDLHHQSQVSQGLKNNKRYSFQDERRIQRRHHHHHSPEENDGYDDDDLDNDDNDIILNRYAAQVVVQSQEGNHEEDQDFDEDNEHNKMNNMIMASESTVFLDNHRPDKDKIEESLSSFGYSFIVISLLIFVINVIADSTLVYHLYNRKSPWFHSSLVILVLSLVVVNVFSLKWWVLLFFLDLKQTRNDMISSCSLLCFFHFCNEHRMLREESLDNNASSNINRNKSKSPWSHKTLPKKYSQWRSLRFWIKILLHMILLGPILR